MAAKIKEGMTGGQVADIIEQNFENLEDKFQQLSDQFDHTKEDINRTLDEYQSQVDNAYGSIAVQVDEEDTTTDNGKIKLKDRAYEPDKFSGKGYKILRKNIVCNTETGESKNILTQNMINEPNTVYEIRYDFDLNGETINIPEGCTLKFEGGSLSNGSLDFLFTTDKNLYATSTIDARKGKLINININRRVNIIDNDLYSNFINCSGAYSVPIKNMSYILDVTKFPGVLSKYNLSYEDDGTTNADNLNNLVKDITFRALCNEYNVTLLFPKSYTLGTSSIFRFKKGIKIENLRFIKLLFNAKIQFDFSDYRYRSIEEIQNNIPSSIENCFRFTSCYNLIIEGNDNTDINNKKYYTEIDCGENTIGGDYYNRITINDQYYYTTEKSVGISVINSIYVNISGLYIHNAQEAITAQGYSVNIDSCYIKDIINDNGITVSYHPTYNPEYTFAYIKNVNCESVRGVGIDLQCFNALVENCYCNDCGNNYINQQEYGIHNSGTAGGAFGCEDLTDQAKYKNSKRNVTFLNCFVRNCYNYAFSSDGGGINIIGCYIYNIISTYNTENLVPNYKLSNILRLGCVIQITPKINDGSAFFPCVISNCHINQVNVVYYTLNIKENKRAICIVSNSYLTGVKYNTINEEYYYKTILNGCILDGISKDTILKYCKLFNCIDDKGNNFILNSGGNRPSDNSAGDFYFDTTLNKPIWWTGSQWVDATGADV